MADEGDVSATAAACCMYLLLVFKGSTSMMTANLGCEKTCSWYKINWYAVPNMALKLPNHAVLDSYVYLYNKLWCLQWIFGNTWLPRNPFPNVDLAKWWIVKHEYLHNSVYIISIELWYIPLNMPQCCEGCVKTNWINPLKIVDIMKASGESSQSH